MAFVALEPPKKLEGGGLIAPPAGLDVAEIALPTGNKPGGIGMLLPPLPAAEPVPAAAG